MSAFKKYAIAVLIVILVGALAYFIYSLLSDDSSEDTDGENDSTEITTFQECVDAGYPVQESYPRQCTTPDGDRFTEEVEDGTGLANPASEYCEEQGGTVDIRDEEDGQVGYCVFDDGSECEEWSYYRGECE